MRTLIGPFTQILPLSHLPFKGPIADHSLTVMVQGGVVLEKGNIVAIGTYEDLIQNEEKQNSRNEKSNFNLQEILEPSVLMPGFIDCHTHLCFAGNRSEEYALRNLGLSYLEINAMGGGIWNTVQKTRVANKDLLLELLINRIRRHEQEGVTTIEIKSGYGLNLENELKQLEVIQEARLNVHASLVPTCLAAHLKPRDFNGTEKEYLNFIQKELFPILKKESLSNRIDIFIEQSAFSPKDALPYLTSAHYAGFDITIHADQFTPGGSQVAFGLDCVSVDHLEVINNRDIAFLARSPTVGVVLPGSSFGLGHAYAPARKILDQGASLAIASDWNPGSSPMGDLLIGASLLGVYEKLSTAEVLAGLTFRAAKALNLTDRGTLELGKLADLQAFPCEDYREILYNQGKLKPSRVWKNGKLIKGN